MSVDAQITLTMKEIERYQEEIILLEQDTLSSKEACEKDMKARNTNRQDSGLKMLREEMGETFAVMSEL